MEGLTLQQQKEIFGQNKIIPQTYEAVILKALSYFPELKNQRIHFKQKKTHPVPYGTRPTFRSIFQPKRKRTYVITIREEASAPLQLALFKNLPDEAQLGVLGHELSHVMQYNSYSWRQLIKVIAMYSLPFFRQKFEIAADKKTIEHGLGDALLAHASYIRKIPGYLNQRPELNKNYLKPDEILRILKASINISSR